MVMQSKLMSFDYGIKYLLKNKGDYEIVEGFISALLGTEGYGPVKISALLDTESNIERTGLKKSIADVVVEDQQKHKYIVEIERVPTPSFIHKACFNTSRLIVDGIESGDDYTTIKKVFHISLLYFKPNGLINPLCHGKTIIREIDPEHPLELHLGTMGGEIFELSKVLPEYFIISVPMFDGVIRQEIDEWLYVMKYSDVKEDFKSPYMKKVADRLNKLKMNEEELANYYKYVKEVITQRDATAAAEARGESKKAKEIALKLLKQNTSLETVADITGLNMQQINELIVKNN